MGKVTFPEGTTLALDTAPLIYFFENISPYTQIISSLFEEADKKKIRFICSTITVSEIFVKPFKNNQRDIQKMLEKALIKSSEISIVPVTISIALEASKIRADYNIRTPDAIQIATAKKYADYLITNDKKLERYPYLKIKVLESLL